MKAWIVMDGYEDFWIEVELSVGNEKRLSALAATGWLPYDKLHKRGKASRMVLFRTRAAYLNDGFEAGIRKAKRALQGAGFTNVEQLDKKEMLDRYS